MLRTETQVSVVPAIFRGGAFVTADDALSTTPPVTSVPVRLSMRAGDQLGLRRLTNGTMPQALRNNVLLVSGVLEPDADHDDYGDESQDACPAEARCTSRRAPPTSR